MPGENNTERIAELERQLAELETVRLLVGGLAHDFNNLLTAIAGHASLLQGEARPGEEVHESATAILKATERATAIAEKLLGVARAGEARKVPVNLHETIAEVSALLGPAAGRGIRIQRNLRAPTAMTLGDPDQIYQLMLNLALNAQDAMPEGGLLSFATEVSEADPAGGPYLVVSVSDTGCGIPSELREHIFKPYFTTREGAKATGLGLSVASRIVEKHNGFIRVESDPGRGSTFRVYLPLLEHAVARTTG